MRSKPGFDFRLPLVAAALALFPALGLAASGGTSYGYAKVIEGAPAGLRVSDLLATKQDDSLLHVQADLVNTNSGNRQVYYRFEWLDRDGFTVWDDEPWKPMIVYGNQKQTISVVSPTFKATDFRLIVQSPGKAAN